MRPDKIIIWTVGSGWLIGNIMEMQFLKKFDVEKWERRKRALPS